MPEVEIRGLKAEEASAWSGVLERVFFEDMAPQYEGFFLPWSSSKHPLSLAAFVDGQMVAGAGGLIVPEYKMAGFFGAATLKEFRGRGIQAAFMAARLKLAQQAGCDLAVTLTMPGTTSERNAERAGFQVAYTKVVVKKKYPASDGAGPVQPQSAV